MLPISLLKLISSLPIHYLYILDANVLFIIFKSWRCKRTIFAKQNLTLQVVKCDANCHNRVNFRCLISAFDMMKTAFLKPYRRCLSYICINGLAHFRFNAEWAPLRRNKNTIVCTWNSGTNVSLIRQKCNRSSHRDIISAASWPRVLNQRVILCRNFKW